MVYFNKINIFVFTMFHSFVTSSRQRKVIVWGDERGYTMTKRGTLNNPIHCKYIHDHKDKTNATQNYCPIVMEI